MLPLEDARKMLVDLGFGFLKKLPTTDTAFWVKLACREFQRYARLKKAAKDSNPQGTDHYAKRLVQVDNASPLPANVPVDGDYNEKETEARIRAWHAANWRIPVVISAWKTKPNGDLIDVSPGGENIWLATEVTARKNVRMFATDLSDLYEPWDDKSVYRPIGTYTPFKINGKSWGGPWAIAGRHTWANINYINLTGDKAAAPTTPEEVRRQQTFRVIAGVANAESEMFFDAMNAYDDSIISIGFYQWTLGRTIGGKVQSGELGGYMALLKYRKEKQNDPSFDLLMGGWDLDVAHTWDTISNKKGLFDFNYKTYKTHLMEQRKTASGHKREAITEQRRGQFFQGWHWFYRFQAASRFSSHYAWSMWHMARVRLRDILRTPWPVKAPKDIIPMISVNGVSRPATIGEVYRSELATAIILRWHVWAPGEVTYGDAGRGIRRAFNRACRPGAGKAGIDPKEPVDKWPAEWEEALIIGLKEQLPFIVFDGDTRDRSGFLSSVYRVEALMTELEPPGLQLDRSFELDDANLPPAPPLKPNA